VVLPGPDTLGVMVLPVFRLVEEIRVAPVVRVISVPFADLSTLLYWLPRKATRILNPQNPAGKVKGCAGTSCHFGAPSGQGRRARHHPAAIPSSVHSATIVPSRRMTTTSLRASLSQRRFKRLQRRPGPAQRSVGGLVMQVSDHGDPAGRWITVG